MAHLLIVEDEAITGMELEWLLTDLGHRVSGPCVSGEDALLRVESDPPDRVLLDRQLAGELDGVAVARQLRTRFNLPFMVISGHTVTDTEDPMLNEKPLGRIRKPFSHPSLQAELNAALAQLGAQHSPDTPS